MGIAIFGAALLWAASASAAQIAIPTVVVSGGGPPPSQTVTDVSLTNAVFPPKSPAGTIIGDLSATTADGSPFAGSFAVQSSGSSARGLCGSNNGANYQVVNFAPGLAHLEVLESEYQRWAVAGIVLLWIPIP